MTILKMYFEKPKPKNVVYKDNRNFSRRDFSKCHPFSTYAKFYKKLRFLTLIRPCAIRGYAFHFVEIQSAFCLYLRNEFEFFN